MTSIDSTAAADYAAAVRAALADLPADQLHTIVDGLDEHLAEVAADGTTDLVEALGPPAAYAAELRSSAGLPSVVALEPSEVSPVVEPRVTNAVPEVARHRWALAARVAIGAVLALLVIVVVRVSEPLNGLQVLIGAVAVGAAWWILQFIGKRANLAAGWGSRLPLVLGAAALVGAVLLGAQFAGRSREVVYVPNVTPPTTFLPTSQNLVTMPDVVGQTVLEARRELVSAGFVVFVAAGVNANEVLQQIVASIDPAPGSVVPVGTQVTLSVSNPPVTTGSSTTATTVAATVGTTVPASTGTTLPSATSTNVPALRP